MTDIYSKGMEFQQAGNMRPKAQALMRHRFLSRRSEDARDPRCSQGTGSATLGDDIEKNSACFRRRWENTLPWQAGWHIPEDVIKSVELEMSQKAGRWTGWKTKVLVSSGKVAWWHPTAMLHTGTVKAHLLLSLLSFQIWGEWWWWEQISAGQLGQRP